MSADTALDTDAPTASDVAPADGGVDPFVSLTGWGRTAPTTALLIRPRSYEEAVAAVRATGSRGSIARGLGRAHGDAARNAGGAILDMTALDGIHSIDADTGVVVCGAGVSLRRLLEVLLPLGWFVPVMPGTGHVTVGGAIGADIHGMNHPAAGSFARHVLSVELLTADGEVRTVPRGTPLFDATTGGLGLTGVILSATVRLDRVATSLMSVDTERARDLDDLLARLAASLPRDGDRDRDNDGDGDGDHHRYAAARIDLLARGAALGRAVLLRGDHAPLDALPARARRRPLVHRPLPLRPGDLTAAPALVLPGLLGRTALGLVNAVGYRAAPSRGRTGELRRLAAFFHPLDGVPHWNRIYGRDGFVRYQFVVGYGQEEALRRIVERVARRGCSSFRAELRRFGEADPGWLSFPMAGWALALDLPAGLTGLGPFLDELDEDVAAAGGRVCLAKDARLRPDLLAAMYPRLDEFRALRAELDPRAVFTSDLSRRLSL
ncbi:FAD-binding protein [Streptomyces sp. NPDC056835]|uniref:FAD-binding protein n=1 Tax=Streptomyces sp. NPDC056835 TaxID=3345956 RepID=UPI003684F74E